MCISFGYLSIIFQIINQHKTAFFGGTPYPDAYYNELCEFGKFLVKHFSSFRKFLLEKSEKRTLIYIYHTISRDVFEHIR